MLNIFAGRRFGGFALLLSLLLFSGGFLRAEVPIVEHLTGLEALPDAGFRFFAVPVKFRGMGTFPVRAFGLVGG